MGCISVSIKDGKISAGANSVADDVTGATTIPTSAWNHIAITRSGSSLKVFLNGNVDGAVTNTRNYTQGSATFRIGASASGTAFGGYVDDLRVTKGVARYTANFIPPISNRLGWLSARHEPSQPPRRTLAGGHCRHGYCGRDPASQRIVRRAFRRYWRARWALP
jgi:hypothetical protein